MTRHIIDKPNALNTSLLAEKFVSIDREAAPREASQSLQKRPKHTGSGRLREFTRIERGVRA